MDILQIHPAKCDGRCPEGGMKVAEEKLDGHRALLHFGRELGRAYVTGSGISTKTNLLTENGLNLPQITGAVGEALDEGPLGYTVLDGEIVVPGYPFEAVQSVMGAKPETAREWQGSNARAVIRVFDILYHDGEDVRGKGWRDRRYLVESSISLLERFGREIKSVDYKVGVDHREMFRSVVKAGGEGIVLKDPNGVYGRGWTKWKKEIPFDVVVMGFTPGKGKYQDMFGAVQFGIYDGDKLREVGQCSGMADGQCLYEDEYGSQVDARHKGARLVPVGGDQDPGTRAWFHLNRENLLDSVIEVKSNGVTKHNRLRHPQFKRMRPDKPAKQCLPLKKQEETCLLNW